jgi:hypothetical protein
MPRHFCCVFALLCITSSATASLDRPISKDRFPAVPLTSSLRILPGTTEVPAPSEAQLTAQTEVFLDGERCQYKKVPATAVIANMVLAENGRTILRIEFSTKK